MGSGVTRAALNSGEARSCAHQTPPNLPIRASAALGGLIDGVAFLPPAELHGVTEQQKVPPR